VVDTDLTASRQTTAAVSLHCGEAEHRDLCDKYVDATACVFSTRQPNSGLPAPVDPDIVDGVVDGASGERLSRELLAVGRTPLFSYGTTQPRNLHGVLYSQVRYPTTPRRVNLDGRPACNCGSLAESPYYFKLNEVDAAAVSGVCVTTDRSPLIAGHPLTSVAGHRVH